MNVRLPEHQIVEIITLLEQSLACKKIVRFLLTHPFAMDTAHGIAEWWIGEDLGVTQDALHHLTACGVVLVRPAGGRNLYSFTANIEIQKALRAYMSREKRREWI